MVACALVLVLIGSIGGLMLLVKNNDAQAAINAQTGQSNGANTETSGDANESANDSADASRENQTITDPVAPAQDETAEEPTTEEPATQTELPADERAASLALDPSNIQTDWAYNGIEQKTVYLTFDDGPSVNTQKVLDILDQYGVKATFFVTGHDPDYRGWIKEAYDRGHTIGMHTYTHDYATVYASVDAYFADLDAVAQVVKDQIGFVPYCIRFPGGTSNTISANYCSGIMTVLSQEVLARGYQYYDWNIGSADAAGNTMPTDQIVASACQEGWRNPMILFHDSAPKTTTVEALPQIIEYYQSRGYAFAAITRDGFVSHHNPQN